MVKLNKIYTKTGDNGSTGLVSGPRRPKFDIRIEAYGTVDEANATIGLARLHATDLPMVDSILLRVQNDLFDLGSDLATPPGTGSTERQLRITAAQVKWIEQQIDHCNDLLAPLKSFVLPGGSYLAAQLHVARTIVRRAERHATRLRQVEPETPAPPAIYLNRLSDLLFVLARVANNNGTDDILWTPGKFTGS